MKYLYYILSTFLFISAQNASARTIAGIEVQESLTLPGSQQPLVLNGAGIRTKFIFDIYIGSLYRTEKTKDVKQILNSDTANRVSMYFLYDEVSSEKLTNGWTEGFRKNNSEESFASLQQRLEQFNAMFETVKEGDVILLDYQPKKGTSVTVKGRIKGSIPGADFNQALLRVWLGEYPADSNLKWGMLGEEDE